ncbi:Fe-S protein assembly co-chaperone HscB [Buchnera aphidicola]|uniref:Fe-S protein assembly co-chaperone HscB n=1 Tax=Buchnera aphidicola TaxID=9 RepID=UPI003463873F
MNYFELFNLPEKFNIEIVELSKKFHQLQRKFHPDLFNTQSELIRIKALNNSTIVNQGYRILRDYLTRAEHLLFLNGLNISDRKNIVYEKNFLIEQLSFYEEIDILKKSSFNKKNYNSLLIRINQIKKKYEYEMEKELEIKSWRKSAVIVNKLFFFRNLKNVLEELKQ